MSEFKDYRHAAKVYRRSYNFARKNYALPLIPLVMGLWPTILSGIKIAGVLFMAITMCREIFVDVFKKVPHFLSRLRSYREGSKDYVKTEEAVEKKRKQVIEKQKQCIKMIKDVGNQLYDVIKEQADVGGIDKTKYENMLLLLDYLNSDEFQDLLDGKSVLTEKDMADAAVIADKFTKSYDMSQVPPEQHGLIRSLIVGFLPAAGYLYGGPQAVDALTAKAINARALATAGSAADVGLNVATKTLGGATKLSSMFFSMPMLLFQLGFTGMDALGNHILDEKIQKISQIAVGGAKTLDALTKQEDAITLQMTELKRLFQTDIKTVKKIVASSSAPESKRRSIMKQLDALEGNLNSYNFSAVTEAVSTLAKTGINLLKDKTFDTAMLGMIAGIAIEKYKNKKEEKLANELLAEEAAKMRKFKM